MSCPNCGQEPIHRGGIGCICGNCKYCHELSAGTSGYCFLCDPRPENEPRVKGKIKFVPGSILDRAVKSIKKEKKK